MKLTYASAGTDERSSSAETPPPSLLKRFSQRFPRGVAMLVLAGLLLTVNVMHVKDYSFLSLFDETQHVDYVLRAADGQVVIQPDDQLTQATLREAACHGSQTFAFPECGRDRYDAEDFLFRGLNSAAGHSPYYYLVTGQLANAFSAVPGAPDNLVTWARLLGSAWLLLGCYLTLRIADSLGIRRTLAVLALVLVAMTPVLLHGSTTVNPDATAFPSGALVLLACLAWERGRTLWILAAAAFACAAFDPTNSVGLLLVLAYLGLRMTLPSFGVGDSVPQRPIPRRAAKSYAAGGLTVIAGGLAAVLTWNIAYRLATDNRHLLELSPTHRPYEVDGLRLEWLVGSDAFFHNFPPIFSAVADVLETMPRALFTSASGFLIVGALFAVIMGARAINERFSALGFATLATLLLATPALVLYNFFIDGTYYEIPVRMELSLLPAVAIVLAGACSGRVARVLLALCAGGLWLAAVVPLADAL
jgi:hypothetical protein